MIQRINNYLLTRYPLVWNTRLVWVAAVNLLLHLFFFISGFSAISAGSIPTYYSVSSVGGTSMLILSFLCSLLVLIVWCVFYLRNNAFKNFYAIGKWYLAKEFIILFFLMGTSITYLLSYQWGVRSQVRRITSQQQMVQEADAINTGLVYLPYERAAYFILNTCAEKNKRHAYENQLEISGFDTATMMEENAGVSAGKQEQDSLIKAALGRPDAISYLHYCKNWVLVAGAKSETTISRQNQQWLRAGRQDAVRAALQSLETVLKKYKIPYRFAVDSTLRDVFSDAFYTVNTEVKYQPTTYVNGYEVSNLIYLERDKLTDAFRVIEDCQLTSNNVKDRLMEWLVAGYTTLSLAILLLCYRRFSRKVFLTSVVGTLVWALLIAMMMAGLIDYDRGENFFIALLVLSALFVGIGLVLLKQRSRKTLAGVLLNWHAYLAPYTLLLVVALQQIYYDKQKYAATNYTSDEALLQRRFPVSYWMEHHFQTIFAINLIVGVVYIALVFNQWAKQWQATPDE